MNKTVTFIWLFFVSVCMGAIVSCCDTSYKPVATAEAAEKPKSGKHPTNKTYNLKPAGRLSNT